MTTIRMLILILMQLLMVMMMLMMTMMLLTMMMIARFCTHARKYRRLNRMMGSPYSPNKGILITNTTQAITPPIHKAQP